MALNRHNVLAIALIAIGICLAIGFLVDISNGGKVGGIIWTIGWAMVAAGICINFRMPVILAIAVGVISGVASWGGLFLFVLLRGMPSL